MSGSSSQSPVLLADDPPVAKKRKPQLTKPEEKGTSSRSSSSSSSNSNIGDKEDEFVKECCFCGQCFNGWATIERQKHINQCIDCSNEKSPKKQRPSGDENDFSLFTPRSAKVMAAQAKGGKGKAVQTKLVVPSKKITKKFDTRKGSGNGIGSIESEREQLEVAKAISLSEVSSTVDVPLYSIFSASGTTSSSAPTSSTKSGCTKEEAELTKLRLQVGEISSKEGELRAKKIQTLKNIKKVQKSISKQAMEQRKLAAQRNEMAASGILDEAIVAHAVSLVFPHQQLDVDDAAIIDLASDDLPVKHPRRESTETDLLSSMSMSALSENSLWALAQHRNTFDEDAAPRRVSLEKHAVLEPPMVANMTQNAAAVSTVVTMSVSQQSAEEEEVQDMDKEETDVGKGDKCEEVDERNDPDPDNARAWEDMPLSSLLGKLKTRLPHVWSSSSSSSDGMTPAASSSSSSSSSEQLLQQLQVWTDRASQLELTDLVSVLSAARQLIDSNPARSSNDRLRDVEVIESQSNDPRNSSSSSSSSSSDSNGASSSPSVPKAKAPMTTITFSLPIPPSPFVSSMRGPDQRMSTAFTRRENGAVSNNDAIAEEEEVEEAAVGSFTMEQMALMEGGCSFTYGHLHPDGDDAGESSSSSSLLLKEPETDLDVFCLDQSHSVQKSAENTTITTTNNDNDNDANTLGAVKTIQHGGFEYISSSPFNEDGRYGSGTHRDPPVNSFVYESDNGTARESDEEGAMPVATAQTDDSHDDHSTYSALPPGCEMRFEGEYSRSVAVTHQDEGNSQHSSSSGIHRSGSNKSDPHTSSPTVDIDLSKDDDNEDEDVKTENDNDDDDVKIIDTSRTSPLRLGTTIVAGAGSIKGSPFSPSWEPSISYTPADCGRKGKSASSSSSTANDRQQQLVSRSAHLPLLRQKGQHFDDDDNNDDDDDDDLFDRRSDVNAKAGKVVRGKPPPIVSDLLSSTVEPDFDKWSLDDLRTEAAKYGLKTTDKATLMKSLRMLWTKTRAKENSNSAAAAGGPIPTKKTLASAFSNSTNGVGGGKTSSVTTKRKAKSTSLQGLGDEKVGIGTATGASHTAGVGTANANRFVDPEAYAVQEFLHSETDFHMQMITFEPLDLDQVHARFLSAGGNANITKHRMLEILDALAVFVQIGLQQRAKRKNKKRTPKKGKKNGDHP